MTTADLRAAIRGYWRVPVTALLAGALAFMGSYALSPQYASSTRLLVRARDTTFLTTTGQSLSNQPGVVDSSLATALADTQSALLDSRTVASMVVDQLHLDRPKPVAHSGLGAVAYGLHNAITKIKAFAVHGMYRVPNAHDAAVDQVFASLDAKQLTTSYVVELTASAANAALAQSIANAAASALVTVSQQRFRDEAAAYRDYLKGQLATATGQQTAAAKAVSDYDQAHGIIPGSSADILSQSTADSLRQQLTSADASLRGAQAALASLETSLKTVQSTDSSTTNVTTGRSSTSIDQTGPSSSYESLVESTKQAAANVAAMQAQRDSIAAALSPSSAASQSITDPTLAALNQTLTNANSEVTTLSSQYQTAVVNAGTNTVDVTRVDQADLPTYPFRPVRTLYLILGAFFGGLVGFFVSYFKSGRRRPVVVDLEEAGTALVPRRARSFLPPLPEGMPTPQTISLLFTGTLEDTQSAVADDQGSRGVEVPPARLRGRHSFAPGEDAAGEDAMAAGRGNIVTVGATPGSGAATWQVWEQAPPDPTTREV